MRISNSEILSNKEAIERFIEDGGELQNDGYYPLAWIEGQNIILQCSLNGSVIEEILSEFLRSMPSFPIIPRLVLEINELRLEVSIVYKKSEVK